MARPAFGTLVKEGRLRKRLTQIQLAEALGEHGLAFTQATISGWESGRQLPDRSRTGGVVAALAALLEIDPQLLLAAAASDISPAGDSDELFVSGENLIRDVRQAAESAKRIWAVNPSALAFATEEDILRTWIEGIGRGLSYVVIWPLDVITSGGFLRARAAFQLLLDRLAASGSGGSAGTRLGTVDHYAFSRGQGALGVDLQEEYRAITARLHCPPFGIHLPFRLFTETQGRNKGVRALSIANAEPFFANAEPIFANDPLKDVLALDQACDRVLAFAHWNAAAVLYDAGASPQLSIYHREVKSLDGTARSTDGGVWRGELEAFEMKRAVESFKEAADHIFTLSSERMQDVA